MRGQAFDHGVVVAVAAVPALDGATGQAQAGEGHHARRVQHLGVPQAVAAGAGTDRRVEGEQPRFQLADGVVAHRAGKAGAEQVLGAAVHLQRNGAAIGQAQRGLEALGQALLGVGAHLEPVHHHIQVVLFVLGQRRHAIGLQHLAIEAKAHITLCLQFGQGVGELALACPRNRGQYHQFGVLGQGQRCVDHLAHRLRLQRQIVFGAVRGAGAGVEQAQVIVDFGDGADGRARVVAGGLLLDRDRRRQALDQVHVGLVHQLQELARVGAQAFDVAALAFGVQRVKRQARLARARQTGDHHQRVLGDVEVDVLEVVRACPAHAEFGTLPGVTQVGAASAVGGVERCVGRGGQGSGHGNGWARCAGKGNPP